MDKQIVGKNGEYFPELDVTGQPYERSGCSQRGIGGDYFVILPRWTQVDEAIIADLEAQVAKEIAPKKAKAVSPLVESAGNEHP